MTTTFGTFDYVIAGAGSAGCLLANRLSADPPVTVLLLEASGKDGWRITSTAPPTLTAPAASCASNTRG